MTNNKSKKKKKKSTKAPKSTRSWDRLPDNLLLSIADRLSLNPADYVRFGAVCKSWHAVATKERYPLARQMPWLMLAEDNPKSKFRRFYSPSDDKIHVLPLPEARKKKYVGSTGGWVVTVAKDLKMRLLNPFTRYQIHLPPIEELEPYSSSRNCYLRDLEKVCLSSNPWKEKGNKLTALAIYCGGGAAFSSPGDRSWTDTDSLSEPIMDAIFYKGHFHAVDRRGDVVLLDLRRDYAKKLTCVGDRYSMHQPYLVESMGDLLVVMRSKRPLDDDDSTKTFFIYKLVRVSSRETARLEPVTSLGDRSLFVGLNNSFSVAATEMKGCRGNCIYFTDDNVGALWTDDNVGALGDDMGVFNLEDQSIEPHFQGESLSKHSPPLWIGHFLWWQ